MLKVISKSEIKEEAEEEDKEDLEVEEGFYSDASNSSDTSGIL